MSKYLFWLAAFIVITVAGAFVFTAQIGQLALPFLGWLVVAGVTLFLMGVQWHVYTAAKHPEKADAMYARFLGMPLEEFQAMSSKARKRIETELEAVRDRLQ